MQPDDPLQGTMAGLAAHGKGGTADAKCDKGAELRTILSDPEQCGDLHRYLKSQCSAENLLFWEAVESFRRFTRAAHDELGVSLGAEYEQAAMGQAVAIYCDFIQTGSLTEVNLPAAIKSSLEGIFTVISSTEAYCHGTTVAAPEPQAANRVSRWSWALSGLKPHRPQSVAMAYSDGDTNDMEIMAGIFDEAQHHAFGLILANNYYGYCKRGQQYNFQQPFSPRPSRDKTEAEKDSSKKSAASLRAGGASSPSRQPEQLGSPRRVSSLRSHLPSPSQAMRALSPRSAKPGKDDSPPVTVVKKLSTCDDKEAGITPAPEQKQEKPAKSKKSVRFSDAKTHGASSSAQVAVQAKSSEVKAPKKQQRSPYEGECLPVWEEARPGEERKEGERNETGIGPMVRLTVSGTHRALKRTSVSDFEDRLLQGLRARIAKSSAFKAAKTDDEDSGDSSTESLKTATKSKKKGLLVEPDSMTDELLLRFLRAKDFNVDKAFQCVKLYCRWYWSNTEDGRRVPVSQVAKALQSYLIVIDTGGTDASGYPIVYMRPNAYVPTELPYSELIVNLVFVLERVIISEAAQKRGITFMCDMRGWSWLNYETQYAYNFFQTIQFVLPVHIAKFVLVDPPSWFSKVCTVRDVDGNRGKRQKGFTVWKLIRPMMTKEFAAKWVFTSRQKIGEIAPAEMLTDDLGGAIQIDVDSYLEQCQADEADRQAD